MSQSAGSVTVRSLANLHVHAIQTKLIKPGDDVAKEIVHSLSRDSIKLSRNDVVAIASKAVAVAEGRIVDLNTVTPSSKAVELSAKCNLTSAHVQVILDEAEAVFGYVKKAILCLKHGVLTANAGIDVKNAPRGHVVLWPKDPHLSAARLRRGFRELCGVQVAVIVVDSQLTPLRLGTTGFALGLSGLLPIRDYVAHRDLYGRSISITKQLIVDDLASAAHLLMGEATEKLPAVLIRGFPIRRGDDASSKLTLIAPEQCIFASRIMRNDLASERTST